jgi:hypothetical protein
MFRNAILGGHKCNNYLCLGVGLGRALAYVICQISPTITILKAPTRGRGEIPAEVRNNVAIWLVAML